MDLSGTIKTYATLAGGTSDSSYYRGMLEWIGQYNDEMEKASPDQKTLDDLESSIKGAINGEEKKISSIQDKIAETLSALKQFHDDCKAYESTLEGDEKSLKSLLEEEGNDIEHLTAVIAEERKNIQDLQVAIDRGEELAFTSLECTTNSFTYSQTTIRSKILPTTSGCKFMGTLQTRG